MKATSIRADLLFPNRVQYIGLNAIWAYYYYIQGYYK